MPFALEALVSALLLIGSSFALIGSIGLARLPDAYARLHGPTKATTLGVGSTLLASSIFWTARGEAVSLHEILVAAFLVLTAPVSAHLLAKVALFLGVPNVSGAPARGVDRTSAPLAEEQPFADEAGDEP
jgi:multicomponent K+:H+ antiporter subunit G